MSLFPMFVKLDGRKCLVVGAGPVAEGKIASLLETSAVVTVIGPRATPRIDDWAKAGLVHWHARTFEPSDLDGVFLAVVATNSQKVNRSVFEEAQKRGVICNVVDVPELCDFYYPAVVRRGSLQIAVSTSGQSPALAQRIRRELEAHYSVEYSEWVEKVGARRRVLLANSADSEERKQFLHQSATRDAFARFLRDRESRNMQRGES